MLSIGADIAFDKFYISGNTRASGAETCFRTVVSIVPDESFQIEEEISLTFSAIGLRQSNILVSQGFATSPADALSATDLRPFYLPTTLFLLPSPLS